MMGKNIFIEKLLKFCYSYILRVFENFIIKLFFFTNNTHYSNFLFIGPLNLMIKKFKAFGLKY